MVYKWKDFTYPVSAQIVGEELEKLEREKGSFVSQDVVDAARSKKSKLHPLFEWDDEKAAENYRNFQARRVMSCLVTTVEDYKEPVRAFICITEKSFSEHGQFQSIRVALSGDVSRDTVLSNAYKELRAFEKKYRDLSELSAICAEINKLLAS